MSKTGPILLIEDDEDDQFLLKQVIAELNIPNEVLLFPNGAVALDYLRVTEKQPFLILCDINMPVMDGIELRNRILEDEYLREKSIPFIYLSTASDQAIVKAAYRATVQGYYKKEAKFDDLKRQIELITAYWKSCLHPNSGLR